MKRLLMSAAMFLCCVATSFAQFSGSGSGTENDPYLILNPIQLNQIRNFQNKDGVYFKLMADIDLTEYIEDEYPNSGWLPIPSFKGVLDGNGKTISNLYINRSESDNVGLISLSNGTIMNLNVKANVSGHNFVGAIAGSGQIFINCHVEGTIKGNNCVGGISGLGNTLTNCSSKVEAIGEGNKVGGLIGTGTKLTTCHSNSNVSGVDEVGGLSGFDGEMSQCYFRGTVKGTSYIGGLVGTKYATSATINSYAIGSVVATGDYVGGLIGKITNNRKTIPVSVEQCYFSGSITGNQNVGGLIGWMNPWYYDQVGKCYANTTIIGRSSVGGIIGMCAYGSIGKCVAITPYIKASVGKVGRILGENDFTRLGGNKAYNKSVIVSNQMVVDVTDDESGLDGMGVSLTTLKLKATYVAMDWDFTDTWAIQETECYPYFNTQTAPPVITSEVVSGATTISGKCVDDGTVTLEINGITQQIVSSGHEFSFTVSPLQAGHEVRISAKAEGKDESYFTMETVAYLGSGKENDPYQVYTASDLTGVYRKGYFRLMNDIDLTDYINEFSPDEGWQSIGRDGSETIHFDGNGHKVTGLWCNSTRDNTGLFSCIANGSIKNLTVETAKNKQVKGGANTGILIGKMINGTIENCRVYGSVADGTPVGGIVGLLDGGKISLCQDSVTINTSGENSYVGGLVGEITGGEIDQCVTLGALIATGTSSYVGGIVGKNYATVTNCYSNANVSSSYNAAGIVAYNYGIVDKCYATGDLFSNNYGAGVIGYNDGINAVVKNCAAMNNKIDVRYESQSAQGGGYGQRIIGGIKNGAPAPDMNNYALENMQVSVNNNPQKVYDDIMNGVAKSGDELMASSTYQELGWDFSNIWSIIENGSYPSLKNNVATVTGPPIKVTAKSYTIEYGNDLPTFEFICEGATLNGTPSITCEATATSPVGVYTITIARGNVVNQNVTYVNGTLTITKAPLTITAKSYTITQGDALPTFDAEYSGFKNDETANVLTKKPTLTTSVTSSSEPGTFDIVASGAEAQNYKISYVKGTLTINPGVYKLTYMVDGEVYKTYDVVYGTTITPEAEPNKEGYTFSGWSEIPTTMPAHDVTITGSFSKGQYKLIYMVDGQTYKTISYDYGDAITPEPAPVREGYTFSGWSEIPETMPAHDVTVIGTFSINSYKLTYVVDGVEYKSYDIEYGATITPEAEPTKEGYTFSGWSEIPTTMPAHDVTITGSFSKGQYKLIYMLDGQTYKTISYDYGDAITPEPAPIREGYTFSGWSEIPATMPAHDVTVTGTFSINSYKLTYVVDGEVYKTYDIEYGATITPEAEPTKEGYTFSGWSTIPTTMPAYDVTITGSFTKGAYKLTYMLDGVVYKTISYDYGDAITPEPAPTKEGYTFSGWSEIPATMPAHDVTVTGSFSINKYKLTYIVDGVEYKSYDIEYGATIIPEAEPTKEGYTFSGWSEIPETMPAHDVTVTGTFTLDTSIEQIMSNANGDIMIFTIDGKRVDNLKKGMNVIRMKDGTTRKVVMK